MKKIIINLMFVLVFLSNASVVVAGDAESELEQQLSQAREKLDEAARKLAKLHASKYGHEGRSKKAMLGILLGDGPERGGVGMVGVTPGGGADQAGLRTGDLIVEIDKIKLSDVDDPMHILSKHMKGVTPGDDVDVVYLRGDKNVNVVITTQAQSSHMMKMISSNLGDLVDLDFDLDGLTHNALALAGKSISPTTDRLMYVSGDLAEYFDVDAGVVVVKPAQSSKLKAGDVLVSVGDETIADLPSALLALGSAQTQQVQIVRHGKRQQVDVSAHEFDKVVKEEIRVIRIKREGSDDDVHVEVVTD